MDWQIWTRPDMPPSAWSAVGQITSDLQPTGRGVLLWRSARSGRMHQFHPDHMVAWAQRTPSWAPVSHTFQTPRGEYSRVMQICNAYVAGQRAACDDLDRPCAVHAGEVHGGEAEELRTQIEQLVAQYRHDESLDNVAGQLQDILDAVDARDSLAHVERAARRGVAP